MNYFYLSLTKVVTESVTWLALVANEATLADGRQPTLMHRLSVETLKVSTMEIVVNAT